MICILNKRDQNTKVYNVRFNFKKKVLISTSQSPITEKGIHFDGDVYYKANKIKTN